MKTLHTLSNYFCSAMNNFSVPSWAKAIPKLRGRPCSMSFVASLVRNGTSTHFVSKFREISKRQLKDVTFLHVHVLSAQRRLFVTKDGYMGTAPIGAQKGDRICVLLGCNVPLIIRPEGDDFLIIGDTYICGMMNGEVMQDIWNGKHRCEDLRFM